MVDGFASTITTATALRNLFLLWLGPGFVLTVLGAAALGRTEQTDDDVVRAISAVDAAMSVLVVITVIGWIVFMAQSWGNVRSVGKSTKIPWWPILKRHVLSAVIGVLALVVGAWFGVPALVLAGALALTYGGLVWWMLHFAVVTMLWKSGSQPTGYEDEVPTWVLVWAVALAVYFGTVGVIEGRDVDPQPYALLTIASGVSCIVAAGLAARLVVAMSRRQDRRLETILTTFENEKDPSGEPVTSKQFETAWSTSRNLVSFDL